MGGTGLEHPAFSSGKTPFLGQSGAECGALGAQNAPLDPELAAVVDAWPTLTAEAKAAVMGIIDGAGWQGA
ncbi:MAG: hypothetical protein IT427_09845 [Pirellulales bacterium]|nr:hypothetical protein [Pirellulales bacterium]